MCSQSHLHSLIKSSLQCIIWLCSVVHHNPEQTLSPHAHVVQQLLSHCKMPFDPFWLTHEQMVPTQNRTWSPAAQWGHAGHHSCSRVYRTVLRQCRVSFWKSFIVFVLFTHAGWKTKRKKYEMQTAGWKKFFRASFHRRNKDKRELEKGPKWHENTAEWDCAHISNEKEIK